MYSTERAQGGSRSCGLKQRGRQQEQLSHADWEPVQELLTLPEMGEPGAEWEATQAQPRSEALLCMKP